MNSQKVVVAGGGVLGTQIGLMCAYVGKDVTFYKINNAGHGVLGFDNDTVLGIVTDFLKKHLGEPHFD